MPQITDGRFLEDVFPHASMTDVVGSLLLTNGGGPTPAGETEFDPDPGVPAGDPGGFSAVRATAVATPIEFDVPETDELRIYVGYAGSTALQVAYDDTVDPGAFL